MMLKPSSTRERKTRPLLQWPRLGPAATVPAHQAAMLQQVCHGLYGITSIGYIGVNNKTKLVGRNRFKYFLFSPHAADMLNARVSCYLQAMHRISRWWPCHF